MIRHLILSALALLPRLLLAQVHVDKPIVLTSGDPAQRQLIGLAATVEGPAAINATTQLDNTHRFTSATGTAVWAVNLPALTTAPGAGTHILVQAPASPTPGALQIQVNGAGPYAVVDRPADTLHVGTADDAPVLSLVFDGNVFHVLNGRARERRPCPSGTAAVNDQFCIETAPRDSIDFYEAGRICIGADMRLCSWGEWHAACQQAALLGLQSITNSWEWSNNSANEDGWVRVLGGTSCTSAGTYDAATISIRYRCCYTR